MNQEINATFKVTTAHVNPQENIEAAVRKALEGIFRVNTLEVNGENPNAIITINVTAEADVKLGNIELATELIEKIKSVNFHSIDQIILSLKEEAEIYGNV